MSSVMRLCPRCRKVSPVSEATWYSRCFHCGFAFYLHMERRPAFRHKKQCPAIVRIGKESYYGYTLDLSSSGARVIYNGKPSPRGVVLDLTVDELAIIGRKVEVVWSDAQSGDTVRSGVRFV